MEIPFGYSEHESLVLTLALPPVVPSGYEWLSCCARVQVGGFTGKTKFYLESGDLIQFSEKLELLYRSLSGEAVLETLESQIFLRLSGDGKGHIELNGILLDRCGTGNKLTFTIQYDQTLLWQTVSALQDVISQIKTQGNTP